MAESLGSASANNNKYRNPWHTPDIHAGPLTEKTHSEKRLTDLMIDLFRRTKEESIWAATRNEALARSANETETKDGIDLILFNLVGQRETSALPIDITFDRVEVESMDRGEYNNYVLGEYSVPETKDGPKTNHILKTKDGYTELFKINGVTVRYGFRDTYEKHKTVEPVCVVLFEYTDSNPKESPPTEILYRLQDSLEKQPAESFERYKNYMLSDYYAFKHRKNPEDQTHPIST